MLERVEYVRGGEIARGARDRMLRSCCSMSGSAATETFATRSDIVSVSRSTQVPTFGLTAAGLGRIHCSWPCRVRGAAGVRYGGHDVARLGHKTASKTSLLLTRRYVYSSAPRNQFEVV